MLTALSMSILTIAVAITGVFGRSGPTASGLFTTKDEGDLKSGWKCW